MTCVHNKYYIPLYVCAYDVTLDVDKKFLHVHFERRNYYEYMTNVEIVEQWGDSVKVILDFARNCHLISLLNDVLPVRLDIRVYIRLVFACFLIKKTEVSSY